MLRDLQVRARYLCGTSAAAQRRCCGFGFCGGDCCRGSCCGCGGAGCHGCGSFGYHRRPHVGRCGGAGGDRIRRYHTGRADRGFDCAIEAWFCLSVVGRRSSLRQCRFFGGEGGGFVPPVVKLLQILRKRGDGVRVILHYFYSVRPSIHLRALFLQLEGATETDTFVQERAPGTSIKLQNSHFTILP